MGQRASTPRTPQPQMPRITKLTSRRIVRNETRSSAQSTHGVVETIDAARGALPSAFALTPFTSTHLCISASSPNELPSVHVATFLPRPCLSPCSTLMLCPSRLTKTSSVPLSTT